MIHRIQALGIACVGGGSMIPFDCWKQFSTSRTFIRNRKKAAQRIWRKEHTREHTEWAIIPNNQTHLKKRISAHYRHVLGMNLPYSN